MKKPLDIDFIDRIIRASVAAALFLGLAIYLNGQRLPAKFTSGFLIGSATGILNFAFLKGLIRAFFHKQGPKGRQSAKYGLGMMAAVTAFLVAVYFRAGSVDALLLGFSVPLAVAMLKGIGWALAGGKEKVQQDKEEG